MAAIRKRLASFFFFAVIAWGALKVSRPNYLPLPLDRCSTRQFDATVWRDSVQAYGNGAPRGCMVDDLLAHHDLIGHGRAEVVSLLGEPRPTNYFQEYDLVYWLGPERSVLSLDSEWLVVRLDSAGRVTERRIVTD